MSNATALLLPAFGVELVLKSTVLCLLALGAAWILRRASAAARCAIWNALILGLLALPLLCAIVPTWNIILPVPPASVLPPTAMKTAPLPPMPTASPEVALLPPPPPMPESLPPAVIAESAPPIPAVLEPVVVESPPAPRFSLAQALLGGYVFGLSVVLLRLLVGMVRLRHLERSAVLCTDAAIWTATNHAAQTLGVTRPITVLLAPLNTRSLVPMTWGQRSPRLLLPADALHWDEPRLRAVLLHEFAHLARADWLLQVMAGFACALYWCHPLVWKIARLRRLDSERASDDRVLLCGIPPADYAAVLLETARARSPVFCSEGAISMAHTAHLSARVQCLLDRHQHRRLPARFALLTGAGISLVVLLGVAALRTAEAPPPAFAPELPMPPAALAALPAENLPPPSAASLPAIAGVPQAPNAPALMLPALATTLDALQPPTPPDASSSDRIAWGAIKDGLQTGLRFVGDYSKFYTAEDEMKVEMLIRNVTPKPRSLQLLSRSSYYVSQVTVERAVGADTATGKFILHGRDGIVRREITLPPNKVMLLPLVFETAHLKSWQKRMMRSNDDISRVSQGGQASPSGNYILINGAYTLEWAGNLEYRNPGQASKQPIPQPASLSFRLNAPPAVVRETPIVEFEPPIAWGQNINGIQVGLLQPYLTDPGGAGENPQFADGQQMKNGRLLLHLGQTFETGIYLRNTSVVPMTVYTAFDPAPNRINGRLRLSYEEEGILTSETGNKNEGIPQSELTLKPGETLRTGTLRFSVADKRSGGLGISNGQTAFVLTPMGDGTIPLEYKLGAYPRLRFEKNGNDILLPTGKVRLLDVGVVKGSVRIEGLVAKPGVYPFDSTMKLSELLAQAGGITGEEPLTLWISMDSSLRKNSVGASHTKGRLGMGLKHTLESKLEQISPDWNIAEAVIIEKPRRLPSQTPLPKRGLNHYEGDRTIPPQTEITCPVI